MHIVYDSLQINIIIALLYCSIIFTCRL